MSQGDQKTPTNQQEKDKVLDELESLSKMLDEEVDDDIDDRTIPEDIPVLKSFVDDVPVLSETLDEPDPGTTNAQPTDSVDRNAATFSTSPAGNPSKPGDNLDMSFLDKDPLEISERVRNYNKAPTANTAPPTDTESEQRPEPAITKADDITKPLNRFQPTSRAENPFLPRSTLDKIRENHAWEQNQGDDASSQLRKLIQDNPLNKVTFDSNNSSKELQALRQKASQLVNEVIRSNMPRLEAELRMKLEQEVDRMFKEIKKNPH
jgi:hypothetical protein